MTFFSHYTELSDGKSESEKSDRRLEEINSGCGNDDVRVCGRGKSLPDCLANKLSNE